MAEMTSEFKEYISELGRMCRDETFHGEYDLNYSFESAPHPEDSKDSKRTVHFEIRMDTVYLSATIKVFPCVADDWEAKDYKQIAKDMLHEVCHLFIEPVADLFMWDACLSQRGHYVDTIERQTQRVMHTIFCLMPADWYLPEKVVPAKTKAENTNN